MTAGTRHPGRSDLLLVHVLFALHAYQQFVQWVYHGLGDSAQHLVFLLAWLVLAVGGWLVLRSPAFRWADAALRVAAVWLAAMLFLPAIDMSAAVGSAAVLRWLQWAGVAAAAVLAVRLGARHWQRLRRGLWVVAPLFVAAEPLLALILAQPLSWPPAGPAPRPGVADARPAVTLVLLLDELNASDAGPIVAALERQGLVASVAPLRPVDDSTLRVVPAMFTHQRFDRARPCSPSAVCSGTTVLDFAKVTAARADIDVVGFYHPYCHMAGLRFCVRTEEPLSFYKLDRLGCSLWRRLQFPQGFTVEGCEQIYNRAWNDMVEATLQAIDVAPVWQRGGMLFAHVPLPHPPATLGGGSLMAQYQRNLGRVADLLTTYVARARAQDRAVEVVIFSDHPLRPAMWCSQWPFATRGCANTDRLGDAHIPLIVATRQAVDLTGLASNDQVFDVLARLGRQ